MIKFYPKQFLLVLLFLSPGLYAQDCLDNLYKANKLLNSGKAEECILESAPCASMDVDASIQWQAHRIRAIAYLTLLNIDSAKVSAEKMLNLYPRYVPNRLKDPMEFVNLLNKFVVIPKYSLGLAFSIGTNTSFPSVSKSYVVADYNKTYTSKNSFQFGVNFGMNLNPKMELNISMLANSKKYDIDYEFTGWKVNVQEQLTYLTIPVTAKYLWRPNKKLRLFVMGGFYGAYMLYSANNFSSTFLPQNEKFKLYGLNSIERRSRVDYGPVGGIGIYYKLKPGHLSFQACYYHSLAAINNADKRWNYPEQIYTYYYVDDNIVLHNLALSIGYTHYLNYKVYKGRN